MIKKQRLQWLDYVVFGLTIFFIFCLIFESYLDLPALVSWLGNWHPLVLHFPIVIVLAIAIAGLLNFKIESIWLNIAVLSVLITGITGFFLAHNADTKGDILNWHQWLGVSLTFLVVLWYWWQNHYSMPKSAKQGIQILLIVLVGLTGHYGGMVTHGEDFLALPSFGKTKTLPENPIVYSDVVVPLLDNYCASCHNPSKAKGAFVLTNYAQLMAGGENENDIVIGKPLESELIKRLHLPVEDKEHMPPQEKKQLSESEIQILERWIALGASDTLKLSDLDATEPLAMLINKLKTPVLKNQWDTLKKVADSTLVNLNSNYVSIERISNNSNALQVAIFLPPDYNSKLITNLNRIAENIINLKVNGLPLTQVEVNAIAKFNNLEVLEMGRTPIADAEIELLKPLSKLNTLKIYNTKVTDAALPTLGSLSNLSQLFIWETQITDKGIADLKTKMPLLHINTGINAELLQQFITIDSVEVDSLKTIKKE